jgi:hypothetical protein
MLLSKKAMVKKMQNKLRCETVDDIDKSVCAVNINKIEADRPEIIAELEVYKQAGFTVEEYETYFHLERIAK